MTYQKVLVPLDGSHLAEKAIPYAKAIASNTGSELVLFTVATVRDEKLNRAMKAYLEHSAEVLEAEGIKVITATARGNAADEIIKFADKTKASLIIISTHGHSGIKRWVLGSVAMKVLYGTAVPVLLVKSKSHKISNVKFKKILVPLDGSPFSEASLPYAEELARRADGEIILLRVGEVPALPADRSPDIKPTWEEYRDMLVSRIQRQVAEYLERMKSNLEAKGIRVKTQAALGTPAEIILQVAHQEDVNLISMTTQGRTGISRWVYGSVASRIVEESFQPLMLIRPSVPK